jgi:putative hydrolase of the HAD superfamily
VTRTAEVRAVLLDADGVVQANPRGWREDLESVAGAEGRRFVDELFGEEQPAMTGERDFREVVRAVARRWGVSTDVEDLLAHWRRIEVSKDTLGVARALRASGVACYLASNQNSYRASYMRESLGYDDVFDGQFYSCDVGATKSSGTYFTRVLDVLGLPGPEVLLVDDSQTYVHSARSAGLRAEQWSIDRGVAALRTMLADHGLQV